eukprot:19375_1
MIAYNKMIKQNTTDIEKNNHRDNIYNGWVVVQNKLIFMELGTDYKLVGYDHNVWGRKKIVTIKLDKYEQISIISKPKQQTLVRYGIEMKGKENTNDNLKFWLKKNNVRLEWLTHFDAIINSKIDGIQYRNKSKNSESKQNDINYCHTEIIDHILMIYDNWKNDKQTKKSLREYLRHKTKVNDSQLLDLFHSVLLNQRNIKSLKYQCKDENECVCLRRHKNRSQTEQIDTADNDDYMLMVLLDKMHAYFCHQNKANVMHLTRNNITSKFVINTKTNVEDQKNNEQKNNDSEDRSNTCSLGIFAFGEGFDCYEDMNSYIAPQFSCLTE